VISDLPKTADELNQPQNVVPFSPLNAGEEALIDAYLRSRRSATITDGIASTLAELGAEPNFDIDLQAIEVGAGLITGKYAGGRSLPNWSIFDIRGGVDYSRALDDRARKNRRLFSILLFEINWTDSGPGFSWPEQYRATWMPKQKRWIVSGSVDTNDLYGCLDFALGHFQSDRDQIVEKARPLILRHWRKLKMNCNQPPWEAIVDPGAISTDVANGWRKKNWPRDPSFYTAD
jgi:hypothetical protein